MGNDKSSELDAKEGRDSTITDTPILTKEDKFVLRMTKIENAIQASFPVRWGRALVDFTRLGISTHAVASEAHQASLIKEEEQIAARKKLFTPFTKGTRLLAIGDRLRYYALEPLINTRTYLKETSLLKMAKDALSAVGNYGKVEPELLTHTARKSLAPFAKGTRLKAIGDRLGASAKALLSFSGVGYVMESVAFRTRQVVGLTLSLAVQVANIPIKGIALTWHTVKLNKITVGMKNPDAVICTQANYNDIKEERNSTVKNFVVAGITGGATVLGGLSGGTVPALTTAYVATLHAMHLTPALAEEMAMGKKATLMGAEEAKNSMETMKERDPTLYAHAMKLQEHIDHPKSLGELKLASSIQKEILDEFRDKQNSMVYMPYRLMKKAKGVELNHAAIKEESHKVAKEKMESFQTALVYHNAHPTPTAPTTAQDVMARAKHNNLMNKSYGRGG